MAGQSFSGRRGLLVVGCWKSRAGCGEGLAREQDWLVYRTQNLQEGCQRVLENLRECGKGRARAGLAAGGLALGLISRQLL